jgi:hypothetical protein
MGTRVLSAFGLPTDFLWENGRRNGKGSLVNATLQLLTGSYFVEILLSIMLLPSAALIFFISFTLINYYYLCINKQFNR